MSYICIYMIILKTSFWFCLGRASVLYNIWCPKFLRVKFRICEDETPLGKESELSKGNRWHLVSIEPSL